MAAEATMLDAYSSICDFKSLIRICIALISVCKRSMQDSTNERS